MKKKPIANFFWNSSKLSIYELCCLNSFIKNNFEVHVYSFVKIKLPKKVKLKNASTILNKKEINKFVHHGRVGCLAAFSDKFRIELQKKKLGWWFDLDVVCLKNSKFFTALEKNNKFVIGMETNNKINNAVLKINDTFLLDQILKKIENAGYVINWGEIGPSLITKILKKNKLFNMAQDQKKFYAINYTNLHWLIFPKYKHLAKQITKDSLCVHSYNEIFNRFGIPKNIMPPKKSFLYEIFIKYSENFRKKEFLPETTASRLFERTNGFKENLYDLFPSLMRSLKKIHL